MASWRMWSNTRGILPSGTAPRVRRLPLGAVVSAADEERGRSGKWAELCDRNDRVIAVYIREEEHGKPQARR
jgi:hypothetical protein